MRSICGFSAARLLGIVAVPLALLVAASPASAQFHAQQQQSQQQRQHRYPGQYNRGGTSELFEWQGRVDKEIRVEMRGNRASVLAIGNHERTSGRVSTMSTVPQQDGTITVQTLEGRGTVDVVQQPNSSNGYTAIIRVRDPDSGQGTYRVAAYWQPNGNVYRGRGNRNGNNGQGVGAGRNGRQNSNGNNTPWWRRG